MVEACHAIVASRQHYASSGEFLFAKLCRSNSGIIGWREAVPCCLCYVCSYNHTLCTAPSVGASGAIFGLVGALAVFLARHKTLMIGGDRSLAQVGRVIAINLGFGLISSGIDNWGHVGVLLGGAAVAWLLGPSFSFESAPEVGKKCLLDRPPIAKLLSPRSKQTGDQ